MYWQTFLQCNVICGFQQLCQSLYDAREIARYAVNGLLLRSVFNFEESMIVMRSWMGAQGAGTIGTFPFGLNRISGLITAVSLRVPV